MSQASASRTIHFLSKAGSFSCVLTCNKGDLVQEYTGESTAVAAVSPSLSESNPAILRYVITSSRTASNPNVTAMRLKVNSAEVTLTKATDTSALQAFTDAKGAFRLERHIDETTGLSDWYLYIVKDLYLAATYGTGTAENFIITLIGTVTISGSSDEIQADYTIVMTRQTGSASRVTIVAGDLNNFTVDAGKSSAQSCTLKVETYQNGALVNSSSVSPTWYVLYGGAWVSIVDYLSRRGLLPSDIAVTANDTLQVKHTAVDNKLEVKVEVLWANSTRVMGSDVQTVTDVGDPYEIQACPDPTDETIEDTGDKDSVTYTPQVVIRGGAATGYTGGFNFTAFDSSGNTVASGTGSSFTVTRDMCISGGGDLSLHIATAASV